MIERIISWSVHNRFLVSIFIGLIVAGGIYSIIETPVDAIPGSGMIAIINIPLSILIGLILMKLLVLPLISCLNNEYILRKGANSMAGMKM